MIKLLDSPERIAGLQIGLNSWMAALGYVPQSLCDLSETKWLAISTRK